MFIFVQLFSVPGKRGQFFSVPDRRVTPSQSRGRGSVLLSPGQEGHSVSVPDKRGTPSQSRTGGSLFLSPGQEGHSSKAHERMSTMRKAVRGFLKTARAGLLSLTGRSAAMDESSSDDSSRFSFSLLRQASTLPGGPQSRSAMSASCLGFSSVWDRMCVLMLARSSNTLQQMGQDTMMFAELRIRWT